MAATSAAMWFFTTDVAACYLSIFSPLATIVEKARIYNEVFLKGGPCQFKKEKRRGLEVTRIILTALVLAAIYFTARELLVRRILKLPQLLIICVALAAALYFLPRYGGALIALIQRVLSQLIPSIF